MNGSRTRIAEISEAAWREAAALAKSAGKFPPPVSLEALARALSVERIVFEPLISDAGLAKHGENFDIVINTESGNLPNLHGERVLPTARDWPDLHSSVRFTIAHELAHLIFLKAARSDRQNAVFDKNEKAIENGCNILARMLLLPIELLARSLANDCLNPTHLVDTCMRCRVSPEVLIRRFHLTDFVDQHPAVEGVSALVCKGPNGLYVKACHLFGVLARARFHRALGREAGASAGSTKYRSLSEQYAQPNWRMEGRTFDELQISNLPGMDADNEQEAELAISWDGEKVIPCVFRAVRAQGENNFFLSLKILGPVQDAEQRVLF